MEAINFFSGKYFSYHAVIVFIVGTVVGSFLNVCIYRLPAKKSIVFPNSFCFSCGSTIRFYDNIPLLSYILLRGRCRDCGSRISPRYFFIEFLTGIIFVLTFWRLGYTWSTPIYIFFICYFIIATFTDLDHWIIPDSISLGGLCLALLSALVIPLFYKRLIINAVGPFSGFYLSAFLNALTGAVLGFCLLYLIGIIGSLVFHKEAMGGGDVKLFAFVGALLGWSPTLIVLAMSSFIGALSGSILLLISHFLEKRSTFLTAPSGLVNETEHLNNLLTKYDEAQRKFHFSYPIPFGPSISVATIIMILWGPEIISAINLIFMGYYYK